MLWLLGLMHIILSLGDVDALIPIIIILILIAAAGGLTRGFDIFSLFGLGTLAGIGLGSKASMASRKTGAYDKNSGQYKEGFISGGNKSLPKIMKDKELSGTEKFKRMGSVRGAKYGHTTASPSLAAGAYHSYRSLSGKNKANTSNPSRNLIPGPNVLTKGTATGAGSSPLVASKAAAIGAGAMTVKQMNDHIANRVRMAVLNPEKYGPKKRTSEQPSYPIKPDYTPATNTIPFSSADNAVGWLLSGRSGAALKTSRMRQLAANDPAAFRKEYNKIVRRELYRHMVNNKMIEKGSSFRMPENDSERMKFRYAGQVYKEWGKEFKRSYEATRSKPASFEIGLTLKPKHPDPATHTWAYDSVTKKWKYKKERPSEE